MMEHTDGEVWEKEYRDTFFGDPKVREARQVTQAKLKPAVRGQAGSLNITPKEKKVVTMDDLAGLFGRAGGAGKPDPGKGVAQAKAKRKLSVVPDDAGNLSVEGAPSTPDG